MDQRADAVSPSRSGTPRRPSKTRTRSSKRAVSATGSARPIPSPAMPLPFQPSGSIQQVMDHTEDEEEVVSADLADVLDRLRDLEAENRQLKEMRGEKDKQHAAAMDSVQQQVRELRTDRNREKTEKTGAMVARDRLQAEVDQLKARNMELRSSRAEDAETSARVAAGLQHNAELACDGANHQKDNALRELEELTAQFQGLQEAYEGEVMDRTDVQSALQTERAEKLALQNSLDELQRPAVALETVARSGPDNGNIQQLRQLLQTQFNATLADMEKKLSAAHQAQLAAKQNELSSLQTSLDTYKLTAASADERYRIIAKANQEMEKELNRLRDEYDGEMTKMADSTRDTTARCQQVIEENKGLIHTNSKLLADTKTFKGLLQGERGRDGGAVSDASKRKRVHEGPSGSSGAGGSQPAGGGGGGHSRTGMVGGVLSGLWNYGKGA